MESGNFSKMTLRKEKHTFTVDDYSHLHCSQN